MKKIFLFSVAFLLIIPSFVLADSYAGPYCFENPSITGTEKPDRDSIRGTCKEVETKTVISLDPALQKDYFLGTHEPITYGCEIGCMFETIYSEYLSLNSSLTLEDQTEGVEESPLQYALFEKVYFVPLLSKMFKESSISFSESTLPNLGIYIFNESELGEIQKVKGVIGGLREFIHGDAKTDFLNTYAYLLEAYTIYSLNYKEYGKGIYAPKGPLVEYQYADLEKSENILSNKDLQIKQSGSRRGTKGIVSVVPVTSPLKSVTNYWIYTKKDGNLVLTWQKSEYILDGGQVKFITNADKNINVTLLFSSSFPTTSATTSDVLPVEKKKGFFRRLWELVLSWF